MFVRACYLPAVDKFATENTSDGVEHVLIYIRISRAFKSIVNCFCMKFRCVMLLSASIIQPLNLHFASHKSSVLTSFCTTL
jgi:hypothetical protein